MMTFTAAVLQFSPQRGDVQANIQKILKLIGKTQADLIVLPELANSGYLYESVKALLPFSESRDGNGLFLKALREIAKSSGGFIVSGYAENDRGTLYNSAVAVSGEGNLANYRKTHLYAAEKSLFQPGNTGFEVFEWLGVKIGMMICFDWIFPESARTLALAGAQIIAHPANLVLPYCQDAMITRSIENRVFTITANRIGVEHMGEDRLRFTGKSQITDPKGNILFRGGKNRDFFRRTTIDPTEALDKKISSTNDLLSDRRTQFYLE